ncbi:tyrosine-type recombinase/integrase [Thermoplasmatota archaeon]
MGPPEFESGSLAPKSIRCEEAISVDSSILDDFIGFRGINGLSEEWIYLIRYYIKNYLEFVDWKLNRKETISYFNIIRNKQSLTSFRKQVYQIRKFLTYLDIGWAKDIKPPSEPIYLAKRITIESIKETLSYFNDNQHYLQIKSLMLLGISSGMRAEELYQLNIEDIDIGNRIIHINHNPSNGQSTKTKISRISFFNKQTQKTISEYLANFNNDRSLKSLFSQSHITRLFRDAPIQVKDLRKFFSQEWDRRGGPTSIKKILMGYSLKGDVDLMHYNAQSKEDLKKIYDKVMQEDIYI